MLVFNSIWLFVHHFWWDEWSLGNGVLGIHLAVLLVYLWISYHWFQWNNVVLVVTILFENLLAYSIFVRELFNVWDTLRLVFEMLADCVYIYNLSFLWILHVYFFGLWFILVLYIVWEYSLNIILFIPCLNLRRIVQ